MADPILLWNEVALEANRVSHSNGQGEQAGPPLSARALAIVHLAMHDAYARVSGDPALPPYMSPPEAMPAGSPEFAVAGAAHRALCALFPSQRSLFDSILAGAGSPADDGHKFGVVIADALLTDRSADPGAGSVLYKPSKDRGRHRPDPDNPSQGFHAPDYGKQAKGFAVTRRWRLAKPPFDNDEYRAALREVRGKGIKPELTGTLPQRFERSTVDETLIGLYWGYDGAFQLGTPPRLYNQIIRAVARAQQNNVAANARLFALTNVAMADAGILAWEQKYCHDFWRPVLGIREHDRSLGPGATLPKDNIADDCDPQWLPLGAPLTNRVGKNFTPPFPAYPSGHASFGAAAFHMTRLFYGQGGRYSMGRSSTLTRDDLFNEWGFVSEELNGMNTDNMATVRPRHLRRFRDGLWQMIEENGRSRVYLGVHWVFDAFAVTEDGEIDLGRVDGEGNPVGGIPLGLLIAEDVFHRSQQPEWKFNAESVPQPCASDEDRTPTYSSRFLE
jgi:membrane-associated phospholipid phosphatase